MLDKSKGCSKLHPCICAGILTTLDGASMSVAQTQRLARWLKGCVSEFSLNNIGDSKVGKRCDDSETTEDCLYGKARLVPIGSVNTHRTATAPGGEELLPSTSWHEGKLDLRASLRNDQCQIHSQWKRANTGAERTYLALLHCLRIDEVVQLRYE